jgi:acetylornithine deacetylase/succinyl-diaminopimelate desuccinylase-like protein
VAAIESYLGAVGRLPVNVVCLFEGEEEIGSPHLPALLARRRAALAADVVVVSDMPMLGPGRPALTAALRGAVAFELEVAGPARDLHSGIFGGAVHNPLQVLCELVAGLHDRCGRVAVPGFYARVRRPSPAARAAWRRGAPGDADVLGAAGAPAGWGEPGYDAYERTTLRPALTVNGVTGGYQGPGGKGVIPARASAKLSARLVPDQEPGDVARLVAAHLARAAPPTVRVRLRASGGARAAAVDLAHPAVAAAAAALRRAFGRAPGLVRSGGTIPIVDLLQRELGAPVLLMGFALPDDGMHGPNERFRLAQLFAGTDAAIALLDELAARVAPRARARRHARLLPAHPGVAP